MVVLAIGTAVYAVWNLQRSLAEMNAMTDARARAYQGRVHLEQVLSTFKDLETGSRGYALTGDSAYLSPYERAHKVLPARYAALKSAIQENLPEDFEWGEIDTLMSKRIQLADQVVAERHRNGGRALEDKVLFDEGRRTMDFIRAKFDYLDNHQDKRIAQITDAVSRLRADSDFHSRFQIGVFLALIIIALVLLLQERRRRRQLEQALVAVNHDLEDRVVERTKDLAAARARISRFASSQDEAVEAERRRLSREVHDQIGQVFTAIKLITDSVPKESFPPDQKDALTQALDMGIASTRKITADLRPPLLDDLGLGPALDYYVTQAGGTAQLRCHIQIADETALGEKRALVLFRISQEAITNTLRHANATCITITGSQRDDKYIFTIADDGKGIGPETTRPGALGMAGMRERAELLGGQFQIRSDAVGTAIEVIIPVVEDSHEEDSAG